MSHQHAKLAEKLRPIISQLHDTPPCQLERVSFEVKNWCRTEKELKKKATDWTVCFANANGGILLLGPEDEKTIQHTQECPYEFVTPDWILQQIKKETHPPVKCAVYSLGEVLADISTELASCIVIDVPPKEILGKHTTHGGVCLVRNHNECEVDHLTSTDDYSAVIVKGASITDLSNESLNWAFRNTTVMPKVHSRWKSGNRRIADLLVDFNLISGNEQDREEVTLAALLLFGSKEALRKFNDGPFVRLTVANPEGRLHSYYLEQNIIDSLRQVWLEQGMLWGFLAATAPTECIRELLVNAFIHREYRLQGQMNIKIVPDDRIEIQNAGGLLRTLKPTGLINANPTHRNRLLTEAAALLGFCEKTGSGIDTVYRLSVVEGFDFPAFTADADSFSAIFSLSKTTQFAQFMQVRSRDFHRLESLMIIKHIYIDGPSKLDTLAMIAQRPEEYARQIVLELNKRGILDRVGEDIFELSSTIRSEIDHPVDSSQGRLF